MAVTTYVLDAGSTWDGTAITDATDFSYSESSNPTRISTDGSRSVNLIVTSGKVLTITVNGVNPQLMSNAKFRAGKSGALVLKSQLAGAGDTTTTTVTHTFGECVLTSISPSVPNESNSSVSITFEAYDSNDDASGVVLS